MLISYAGEHKNVTIFNRFWCLHLRLCAWTLISHFSVMQILYKVLELSALRVSSPNTGKYGPENTPYLDTFHAVLLTKLVIICEKNAFSMNWFCIMTLSF